VRDVNNDELVNASPLTGNFSPHIENEPVPSLLMKSPPVFSSIADQGHGISTLTLTHEVWDSDYNGET
jgi:hypothetical protein